MKLAKLSLAAIVVAGLTTSSFAADSLEGAFKEGKVSGELKAYYFTKDNGTTDADIFTSGLTLGYKTGSLYGFSLGLTAQASASPFADVDGKNMFEGSMYGPGAVLSEVYVAYNLKNTTVMVGRMFLDTPLVASSGSRIVRDAFEGAAVINTDLPNTTLIAGYVQKHQDRTSGTDWAIGEFSRTFALGSIAATPELKDGGYTLAAINKSVAGLTLTAAYADAVDIVKIAYLEGLYEGKAGEIGYNLAGQYYYNKFDNGVEDTINVYALKAGVSFKGINAYAAYSKVSDDAVAVGGVVSGLGNGADLLYTGAVIAGADYSPDAKAYAIDVNYDVTAAANVGVRYVDVKNDSSDYENTYTSVYAAYKCEGALKGLKVSAEYETRGKDADGDDLWLKAGYKF